MDERPGGLPWSAAQRVEAWAAELLVNGIRLALPLVPSADTLGA